MRIFDLELVRSEFVSPSFKRLVFKGDALHDMVVPAPDQRVKLLFPAADGRVFKIADNERAVKEMRKLGANDRPAMRVYTIRSFSEETGELEIIFVLHGTNGPASCWAIEAKPGDQLQMIGKSRSRDVVNDDFEWCPPAQVQRVLLLGDETALPAIAGIVEDLSRLLQPPTAQVFIEVPLKADCWDLPVWPGLDLHWLVREEEQRSTIDMKSDAEGKAVLPGDLLRRAIQQAYIPTDILKEIVSDDSVIDLEQGRMWEISSVVDPSFYVWIAGESAAVVDMRCYLIEKAGLPRHMLNLMGYWRYGKKAS